MPTKTSNATSAELSGGAGLGSREFVGAPEPVRKRNLRGMALSALAVTLGTMMFVYFFGGADARDPIVGMQRAVSEGEVVVEADLVQVDAAFSANSDVIAWSNRAALVGREASALLPEGALPNSESVREPLGIPKGLGELGVHVDLGALPSQDLSPGDRLDIVIKTDKDPIIGAANVEVRTVAVGVERTYLTVLIPAEEMADVAAAVSNQRFRLVRVDQ